MWGYILSVLIGLVFYKWIQSWRQAMKLPPRKPGWPIIGSAFDIDSPRFHVQLVDWTKKYGDIFTMWNFGRPTIIAGTFELMEEILNCCDNRISMVVYDRVTLGGKDLVVGDIKDPNYRNLRKIVYKALKTYGTLLKDLEVLLQDEIEEFVDVLEKSNQKPVEPRTMIRTTLCCIISSLMLGEKLGRDHPDVKTMLDLVDDFAGVTYFGFGMELDYFPWLQHFNTPTMKKIKHFEKGRDTLFDGYLQQFRESWESGDQVGLIHLLMNHDHLDATAELLNNDQIKATFVDFLIGGIETSRVTTLALILLLVHNPGEQNILQREIDDVIGRSRSPTLEDQGTMLHLKAALLETLRFVPPSVMTARCAHRETQVAGYTIPEKTQFLMNIWGACHDPDFWEEPSTWRPGRFLDSQGQLLPSAHPKRHRISFAFGGGKRVCPGKGFAEARLFMLFATLLQKFDLRPDPDNPPPYLVPKEVITNNIAIVPEFTLRFVPRN